MRPYWKGYLKLALVFCPVALHAACSTAERIAFRQINKATGKPEITWFKAIQGNDSFYVVQVAFKAWPSKEQITQWMGYLKEVTVCDTRLPDRACAAPGAAQPRPQ